MVFLANEKSIFEFFYPTKIFPVLETAQKIDEGQQKIKNRPHQPTIKF